jgi:hypothetical protein
VKSLAQSPNVPQALKPLLSGSGAAFETFVHTSISTVVRSEQFSALTVGNLQAWHAEFRQAIITSSAADVAQASAVRVAHGPYISLLADQTDNSIIAYTISVLPKEVANAQVPVLDMSQLTRTIPELHALHVAAPFLPWIAGVTLLGGILIAPRRAWTLIGGGFFSALLNGAALVGLGSSVHREAVLLSEKTGASSSAADTFVGTLAMPLGRALVLAIAAALVAVVVGIVLAIVLRIRDRRVEPWDWGGGDPD